MFFSFCTLVNPQTLDRQTIAQCLWDAQIKTDVTKLWRSIGARIQTSSLPPEAVSIPKLATDLTIDRPASVTETPALATAKWTAY